MLTLFNTLSGAQEPLPRSAGRPLRLFVCGPTVYDFPHLGHARTYLFFDFFVKYLRNLGRTVRYVQNITDIDDKIIRRAAEAGSSPHTLAAMYARGYLKDMADLGITAVDTYAYATQFIPDIVSQVARLLAGGYAYAIQGDGYYFDIAKFPEYGKLSRRTAAQAEDAVSRIDEAAHKRNRGDFCVWKFSKPGEPAWAAPFGNGRPGWHIEDTAISEHYFGPQYDLHGGGLDLKFPHHEAEIAQQEAASGRKPFVKLWMHTGILTIRGEKMSKSTGNFVSIRDYLKTGTPAALRFLFLSHHYRAPMNYDDAAVLEAERSLDRLAQFLTKLAFLKAHRKRAGKKSLRLAPHRKTFKDALADDLNAPGALAAVFTAIREANEHMWDLRPAAAEELSEFIKSRIGEFGIGFAAPAIPLRAKQYAARRETYRTNQQFMQADDLRKRLNAIGYGIEDTPLGPFLWPNQKNPSLSFLRKT